MNKYISRGIDYRGHLASRLRDLEGFDTLAYELIQNADDAEGVSKISFDITDEALIVENDGKFSDCGQGGEQRECSWKGEKGYMCDFHRFRMVSSEDKRRQEDTTGAFGIGFSVVYQITDQPELISSGRHWIIREWEEENRRIEVCTGCGQCQGPNLPGTRFIFPWARDKDSKLRRSLNLTAVDNSKIDSLFDELDDKLPTAILFLRRIKRIDLKRNGKIHKSIECLKEGQSLIIFYDQKEVVWHLFKEKFDAQKLRNKYQDKIESKRSSEVTIAIPEDPLKSGLLCSTLPTRHQSGLPFHVNADFFTTSNRKDVIFDGGYQAEWNIAAIQKAASMIAEKLDDLASSVGHRSFWSLIASIKEVDESPFKVFWDDIKKRLPASKTIYTVQGEWVYPKEAFLFSKREREDYDAVSVLQGLGLQIVHDDLEPYRELLEKEAKVSLLSVKEIIRALEKLGLKDRDEKVKEGKIPQFLREPKHLGYLWKIIGHVLKNEPKGGNIRNELAKCSIALTRDRSLHRCDWVYYENRDDVELFEKLGLQLDFLADEAKDWDEIKNLCRKLDANTVIAGLRKLTFNEWQPELESLLKWFERNGEVLKDENLKKDLSQLHIFPAYQGGLRPLDQLVLPGGFEDPLGVTDSIDVSKIQEIKEFLQKLGLRPLSLEEYITQHLPRAFQNPLYPQSIKKVIKVIEILVKNFENIKDNEKVKGELRKLSIIKCDDGEFYKPEEAYFPEVPVEVIDLRRAVIHEDEIRKLYKWLGVNERVRVQDLIDGIRKLTSEPPTEESKRKVQAVWEYLSRELNSYKEDDKNEIKNKLSSLKWLPAQGNKWLALNEVYSTLQRNLFSRSGAQFLDIPDEIQKKSKNLLEFLGIKIEPEVKLVVEHLLNSAERSEDVDRIVYDFLDKHANDSEIQRLKHRPCLLIKVESQRKYVRPKEVFWKKHSLEPFRYTLDQSWEDYRKLLHQLGVREEPDHEDAIAVLQEIAREYGETNRKLDDKAYAVVQACWSMIAKALKDDKSIELRSLSDKKVIPDRERLLKPPSWMYIKDRADLASKFKVLEHNLIDRIEEVWPAWHAAGAKMLSECVRSEVQASGRFEDEVVLQRLQERKLELKRVLDSFGGDILKKEFGRLLQVKCYKTDNLQVRYILDSHETSYEEAKAHLKEKNELYYVLDNGDPPWSEIACELAQAICPDKSGPLASCFDVVLTASTREDARNELDRFRYPALEEKPVHEEVSHEPARLGASSSPMLDKELEEPQMIEEPAGVEVIDRRIPSPIEAETKLEERSSQLSQPIEPRPIPKVTTPQPSQGRRRDQSRFPVYVSHQDEAEGREAKEYAPRDQEAIEVEEMAIKRVMQFEKKEGRSPEQKPRNHPGYDIESRDASGNIRYIEVKGLADEWGTGGIALTDKQFQTAQEKKDQYWLYIVEHATQEKNYKIYRIQDPANKANQFFYDGSWKQVAEVIEEAQQD